MVLVGGQKHVLGDVDLDAMPLEDRVSGHDVDEAVEHVRTRLREAGSDALTVGIRASLVVTAVGRGLSSTSDNPKGNAGSEYLGIVVVDLAFDAGFTRLIEAWNLSRSTEYLSGISIRWKVRARRFWPRLDTFCVSPRMKVPAGMSTC